MEMSWEPYTPTADEQRLIVQVLRFVEQRSEELASAGAQLDKDYSVARMRARRALGRLRERVRRLHRRERLVLQEEEPRGDRRVERRVRRSDVALTFPPESYAASHKWERDLATDPQPQFFHRMLAAIDDARTLVGPLGEADASRVLLLTALMLDRDPTRSHRLLCEFQRLGWNHVDGAVAGRQWIQLHHLDRGWLELAQRAWAWWSAVLAAVVQPIQGSQVAKGGSTSAQSPTTPSRAFLSVADLATRHGVNAEALRKRLGRWRKRYPDGAFIEDTERRSRAPAYLYREDAVMDDIAALSAASAKASGERPA